MKNPFAPNPNKMTFENIDKSKGIADDFAIRKVINTAEGTIEKVPVNDNDITNKAYVDSKVGVSGSFYLSGSKVADSDKLNGQLGTYYEISGASIGKYVLSGATWTDLTDGNETTLHTHTIATIHAGNDKIFQTDNVGHIKEIDIGASGLFLKSNGASADMTWATPTGTNYLLSGANYIAPITSTQFLSGCGLKVSGNISGSNVFINDLSLSGATFTSVCTPADHSSNMSGSEMVGVIYNTSGTPPTASTTTIGTIYLKYTA